MRHGKIGRLFDGLFDGGNGIAAVALELGDRVFVMRDGRVVGACNCEAPVVLMDHCRSFPSRHVVRPVYWLANDMAFWRERILKVFVKKP